MGPDRSPGGQRLPWGTLPSGDARIAAPVGDSELVIRTTSRLAGAIDSLRWAGREFIDSADHGRQLQSAANFDWNGRYADETFNPTEAGSRRDGAGPTSSSRLLRLRASGSVLQTESLMAFWLAPGEESGGHPAANDRVLSDHRLAKRVEIGVPGLPHAIDYQVAFTMPPGERHEYAQFESLTGYMPPDFARFWALDVPAGQFVPLSDGPGEQIRPVAFSTEDGRHAMGILGGPAPAGLAGPGYGRFRFIAERVVKWNCVYRRRDPAGVKPGVYRFRHLVAIGSLEDVRQTMLTALGRPGWGPRRGTL